MKSRVEAAAFAEKQFSSDADFIEEKGPYTHYGVWEVRKLLDFIYESSPETDKEFLRSPHPRIGSITVDKGFGK